MRDGLDNVLLAPLAMIVALDPEIERLYDLAPGDALLLAFPVPVGHALFTLRRRLLAPRLGNLAQFLFLLALILRRQRFVVARDQAAIRRSVEQGHVVRFALGFGDASRVVECTPDVALAKGVVARGAHIFVAHIDRAPHD